MAWYGGGRGEVGVATGTGRRHEAGEGPVPIARVLVKGQAGTRRDEYSSSTDAGMTATAMIEAHGGRRDREAALREARRLLGLESTRGRCRRTVPGAAPCPLGPYTVVALLYRDPPGSRRVGRVGWPGRTAVTSSDAPTSARRRPWRGWAFPRAGGGVAVDRLPEAPHEVLSSALAPAA